MGMIPALRIDIHPELLDQVAKDMTVHQNYEILDELCKKYLDLKEFKEIVITNREVIAIINMWFVMVYVHDMVIDEIKASTQMTETTVHLPVENFLNLINHLNMKTLNAITSMFAFKDDDEIGKEKVASRPDFNQLFTILFWDVIRWHANNTLPKLAMNGQFTDLIPHSPENLTTE